MNVIFVKVMIEWEGLNSAEKLVAMNGSRHEKVSPPERLAMAPNHEEQARRRWGRAFAGMAMGGRRTGADMSPAGAVHKREGEGG